MNATLAGQKQRWAVATIGAGTVFVLLLFLFRSPPMPTDLAQPSADAAIPAMKAAVQLAQPSLADQVLKDETELRDLRPLFLPTGRNAMLPELKREPGRTFLDNETVKLSFLEAELNISKELPPVAIVNGKRAEDSTPLDALASEASNTSLLGFGRMEVKITPLKPRGGFVEVISAATGERVSGEALPMEARPPGDKPWAPLEFLARNDAVGLAAPLVVTTSSGVEEVDTYFRKHLTKTYRIGERFPPGFYRVIVAP